MPRIFAYIAYRNGVLDDSAAELAAAAKKIDPNVAATAIVAGSGPELEIVCAEAQKLYAEIWKVSSEAFSYPNAELIRKALMKVVPADSIMLVSHDHFGIDLAPGLSIKLNAAFVSDVTGIESSQPKSLTLARQEFGGQVSAHVNCDISSGAVITIRPGAFKSADTLALAGVLIDKSSDVGTLTARRRYVETILAETSDVDITKHAVLVSIGRGIQEKDNIGIADELAEALGAAVSCSRPVVDAKWLQKSRQVGSSGKTVKPKVYLACGISGAFQHLAGIKGNPFIIAINKNPKAPIFQVADIGIVDDILEFLPELTTKVQELRGVAAK
jgi:electron transfer flavoprotein alpha subunit